LAYSEIIASDSDNRGKPVTTFFYKLRQITHTHTIVTEMFNTLRVSDTDSSAPWHERKLTLHYM